MKVLWLTFIPSPYRCAFFEELGKSCDLTVLFERASSNIRGNVWDDFKFSGYEGKILPGVTIGGHDRFCPSVRKFLLDRSYDKIVISNPTSPTGIYAATVLKAHGRKYMVESDGAFPSGTGGIKSKIKKFVMADAMVCFSTADTHDEYYMESGVKRENLRRYPFTSIGDKDIETAQNLIAKSSKDELKAKLGMTEEKIVLSVGQFVHRKGYDILFEAVKSFDENTGVYIIGGTPTEEYLEFVEKNNLKNIHFEGFKKKDELAQYYAASDIFVLPTREDIWGLVINEAMAFGLPIVTTDRCVAGLELIKNGKNGFIVPVENSEELYKKINELLALNKEDYCEMQKNAIEIIKQYTYEKMAETHMSVFEE